MKIRVEKIDDRQYSVDGFLVFKDQNEKWIGDPQMTPKQVRAFQKHLKSEERNHPPDTEACLPDRQGADT